MNAHQFFLHTLAEVCLQDHWQLDSIAARIHYSLQAKPHWVKPLVRRILRAFPVPPTTKALWHFLREDKALAASKLREPAQFRIYPIAHPVCHLAANLPPLDSVGALCHWLTLSPAQLHWLADRDNRYAESREEKVRHYRVSTLPKRKGGVRLLESPKETLKRIQQRIHRDILQALPLHPAAYGFVTERTPLAHAQQHVGQAVVLRFDLSDCFLHVHGGKVFHAFQTLGFPDQVCKLLMALCTHRLPMSSLKLLPLSEAQLALAQQNHLPQGAPSSPLLSHFALLPIDKRMAGYARALGARYSRYADDLVISGGPHLQRQFSQIQQRVAAILLEEGFLLNFRKSLCRSQSQRQLVTGIVVNKQMNTARDAFDRLKAELHNCTKNGWHTQTEKTAEAYRAHLRGRIGWFAQLSPNRAEKLERLFAQIRWDEIQARLEEQK